MNFSTAYLPFVSPRCHTVGEEAPAIATVEAQVEEEVAAVVRGAVGLDVMLKLSSPITNLWPSMSLRSQPLTRSKAYKS